MTVFLDLDGVIVNFADSALRLHNREDLIGNHDWNLDDAIGITDDKFWAKIDAAGPEWWVNLPKYPWASELITFLIDQDVCLLTSPSRSAVSAWGKVEWIKNNFGERFRRYFIGNPKELLARPGRILIDDSDDNIHKFCLAGGEGLLFPRCWNELRLCADDPMGHFYSAFASIRDRVKSRGIQVG